MPALQHFIDSPSMPINDIPIFNGAGVYALYIDSPLGSLYSNVSDNNYPIYVGKAVPSGSRQGKISTTARQLRGRLFEHRRSLVQGGLPLDNISCRFMVMAGDTEDLIPAMESLLIKHYHPLWNSYIDGFGIHTPGKGRFNQQPSEWDTIHPGRPWLNKLTGKPRDPAIILKKIEEYTKRHI
jgi:hypothetical protein